MKLKLHLDFGNWYSPGYWSKPQRNALFFAETADTGKELSTEEQEIGESLKRFFSYQTNYACVPLYKRLIEDLRKRKPLNGDIPWEKAIASLREKKEVEIVGLILKSCYGCSPLDISGREWDVNQYETITFLDPTIVLAGKNVRAGMPLQEFLLWFRGIDDSPKDVIAKWSGIAKDRQQEVYEAILDLFIKKANYMRMRESFGLPIQ